MCRPLLLASPPAGDPDLELGSRLVKTSRRHIKRQENKTNTSKKHEPISIFNLTPVCFAAAPPPRPTFFWPSLDGPLRLPLPVRFLPSLVFRRVVAF